MDGKKEGKKGKSEREGWMERRKEKKERAHHDF